MEKREQLGPYAYRWDERCFPLGADSLALGEFCTLRKGNRVLDLGCGAGLLLLLFARPGGGASLCGVELDPAAAGLARSANRRTDAELCLIRLSDEGLDESFPGLSARIARLEERLDCALLLHKAKTLLGIHRLMLAGGGYSNGSFLAGGLIDEVSLVVAPVADGNTRSVSRFERFDFLPNQQPAVFSLLEAKRLDGDGLWLRYQAKGAEER